MQSFTDIPATDGSLDSGVVLLDVREPDEWAAGHVAGAVHIPLAELPERQSEIPEGDLWIHCEVGGRASRAAQFLAAQGIEAHVLGENVGGAAAAGLRTEQGA
ncbi:rhodanese-like domain-containing protein [Dietzia sp.]|uniref:rhodanese-like domain-containing protein n=1 Tax=Dietzia sp. TaxID=1871616 RepID=UPI002FD8C8AD